MYPKCYLESRTGRENLNLILIHDSVDFIQILVWEPSAAKVSKSYSPPFTRTLVLNDFSEKLNFRY